MKILGKIEHDKDIINKEYFNYDLLISTLGYVPLQTHLTIYDLTFLSGTFSAKTYDPNGAAQTVNIPTTTSHINEGGNLYFTDARAVSALTETLTAYVMLTGEQTILGKKNFTGGLLVNGSPIYYDTENKYWKLEGDLLVTGGVTMYGDDGSGLPSIFDSLPIASNTALGVAMFDSTYFSVDDNGMVTLTSSPSSVSILSDLLDVDASVSGTATVDRVLYQQAGTSTWTWKELTSSGVVGDYLPLSGGTLTGDLTISGNVGIGTTSPSKKLHVVGDIYASTTLEVPDIWARVYHAGGGQSYSANNTGYFRFGTFDETDGGMKMQFGGTGTTGTLQVIDQGWNKYLFMLNKSGNVVVSGGISMYSDARKKTILNHVELSLKQIADAPLIEHYYNSDQDKTTHVGSIAQYWVGLNDWFCKLGNDGYYTMEIQNAALASAISIARELTRYESKTDKKIKQLKKRIRQLEDEVELLKKGA